MTVQFLPMVLQEYKYVKMTMILVLEVGKWQGNIWVFAQIMDIMIL